MSEYLDIVDEHGEPVGRTVERSVAHLEGVRHRTSHLWLLRRRDGRIEVLLQKRALTKSFPGCYDISSAGHIPAGDDYEASAVCFVLTKQKIR
jgi:isopentenyldiphosphate isomerase